MAVDHPADVAYHPITMDRANLDELQRAYKQAVDQWVAAIRAEEALATPDHSEIAMERWDAAGFAEQNAQSKANRQETSTKTPSAVCTTEFESGGGPAHEVRLRGPLPPKPR